MYRKILVLAVLVSIPSTALADEPGPYDSYYEDQKQLPVRLRGKDKDVEVELKGAGTVDAQSGLGWQGQVKFGKRSLLTGYRDEWSVEGAVGEEGGTLVGHLEIVEGGELDKDKPGRSSPHRAPST